MTPWPWTCCISAERTHYRTFPSSVTRCLSNTLCVVNSGADHCGHAFRGGKVAMAVALDPHLPDGLLSHLIIADIAPSKASLSQEFREYIEGMKKIDTSNVPSRKEAKEIL